MMNDIIINLSVGWDVKWCLVLRIKTTLARTQKTVLLDFEEE